MSWMNEWEIDQAGAWLTEDQPNLIRVANALVRLKDWTNANSDGWPYWRKPAQAAAKLMDLLHAAEVTYWRGGTVPDITTQDVTKALRPVKAFLTREGADWAEVLG